MKLALNIIDFAALGVVIGSISRVLPAMAALLAVIYYGFVIYDRVRYGPDLDGRTLWNRKKDPK
jgi:hypothetical protein